MEINLEFFLKFELIDVADAHVDEVAYLAIAWLHVAFELLLIKAEFDIRSIKLGRLGEGIVEESLVISYQLVK